jgi:hypothetical protein
MNGSSEKSVRLPMFDGSHKNFQLWWTRFVAYTTVYNFVEVVRKDASEADMPSSEMEVLDETDDDEEEDSGKEAKCFGNGQSNDGIYERRYHGNGLQGDDYRVAKWFGAPGDKGAVQEISAARYNDASGATTNAQQD